jgi:hypothetical protein
LNLCAKGEDVVGDRAIAKISDGRHSAEAGIHLFELSQELRARFLPAPEGTAALEMTRWEGSFRTAQAEKSVADDNMETAGFATG